MKFPHNKYGIKHDPKGAHVTLEWKGRTLLGEVKSFAYDEVCGCIRLTVTHFNGDPWPIKPTSYAVDVLDRTIGTIS